MNTKSRFDQGRRRLVCTLAAGAMTLGLIAGPAQAQVEVAKLTAGDAAAFDVFGHSVAIAGDTAIVGAFQNDDAGSGSGSAYVFELAVDCVQAALDLADAIVALDLSLFNGPNDNANSGRRNSLASRAAEAADSFAMGDVDAAIELLTSLLSKIDGQSPPPDWMFDSPEKTGLADEVSQLISACW